MKSIIYVLLAMCLIACSENKMEKKGFQVNEISEDESGNKIVGLPIGDLNFETRPRNVLKTFDDNHRLSPVYKVNYDKKTNKPFTGSNAFHTNWYRDLKEGNNWNGNFMPGFRAMYGYNFINISHFNHETKSENRFFNRPVLIKTLYYPANSKDTLNFNPVKRDYYMVSVYDEDSNGDGFINTKDLRRFYHFDINGKNQTRLIPEEYSVMNSEYDAANDFMYVFAKLDENQNGQMESEEPTSIFWIDLSDPSQLGLQYETK
ncbi:MAG: hypothetical protein AAF487_04260 [Bacteroidota bacterium]